MPEPVETMELGQGGTPKGPRGTTVKLPGSGPTPHLCVPVAAVTVPQRAYSPHWFVQASAHLQLPIGGCLRQGDDLLGCNPFYPLWAPRPASSFHQFVLLGCLPSYIWLWKAAVLCSLPSLPLLSRLSLSPRTP